MMLLAPVTNWEPHGVTLAGYCYVMRHGMNVIESTAVIRIFTPKRKSESWENWIINIFKSEFCTRQWGD
jgi:hypothetical protein